MPTERAEGRIVSWPLLAVAAAGVGYSLWCVLAGTRYSAALGWVDVSTILFISLLIGRGAYVLRTEPPLKVFSLSLLNAFSFIYCFESIYKLLFFGWLYEPTELRELLLQVAATLTIALGFHYRDFVFNPRTATFASLFVVTMAIWVALGYPQLYMGNVHPALIDVAVGRNAVYAINRLAKGFLFLGYFFLYAHPLR